MYAKNGTETHAVIRQGPLSLDFRFADMLTSSGRRLEGSGSLTIDAGYNGIHIHAMGHNSLQSAYLPFGTLEVNTYAENAL